MATARAVKDEERGSDDKLTHGCGQVFTYPGAYAKHALKCDGKPVQRRGRIERLDDARRRRETGGRPRKAAGDEKTERRREQYRNSTRKRVALARAVGEPSTPAPETPRLPVPEPPRRIRVRVEPEIASCARCAHAPVCILRARLAGAAEDLTKSVEMTLAGIDDAPTLRIDIGCSLYLAEAR